MAIPAEHLYDSCTCESGMRDGQRCADCGGRGIIIKGAPITGKTVAEASLAGDDDGLDDLSITHLRSRAKDLGLSAGGSKAALVKAIREATAAAEDGEDGEDGGTTDNDAGDDA